MSFLDQKEEVIDLILTRKGRELLAKGRFKPDSYSFYDDEVIYDSSHGSLDEGQNEIVNRIKEMLISKNQTDWEKVTTEKTKEKDKNLLLPIGKSSPVDEHKPAWNVSVSEGKMTGSVKYIPLEYSGSVRENTNEHIPQIDVICEYNLYEHKDQLFLIQSSDDLLIDVVEKNSTDSEDNFEIEFFEYLYNNNDKIIGLEKKYFSDEDFSESVVEYYFNFFVDEAADNPIKLKHVDIDGGLKKEEDDCKIDPRSCANEKIKQLREEIEKLKLPKVTFTPECPPGFVYNLPQRKCVEDKNEIIVKQGTEASVPSTTVSVAECSKNSDCRTGEKCSDGVCRSTCAIDSDCGLIGKCVDGVCFKPSFGVQNENE